MCGYLGREPTARPMSMDPVAGRPDGLLPLMFLHIPRTAGFTLKAMLESTFGSRRSLLDAHYYDSTKMDMRQYAFIEGHFQTSYLARVFGPHWHPNGMTILREPVARVVSQARHIRSLPNHRHQALFQEGANDPTTLFENVPELNNLQTRMLAQRFDRKPTVDDSALPVAMATLDELAFGLTERFNDSITLFAERYDLEVPRFGIRNASPSDGDEDLRTDAFRAAALAANDLDVRLYRHATDLFASRVNSYVDGLLGLSLVDGRFQGALDADGRLVRDGLPLEAGADSVELSGFGLVDGHAPDAVLACTGGRTTPLCSKVFRTRVARRTHDVSNLHVGFLGTVEIPRTLRRSS